MAIADANASSTCSDHAALTLYREALDELVAAAQALYLAWGRVLLAQPPGDDSMLAHLGPAYAERILTGDGDPEVVREALVVATQALAEVADEMRGRGRPPSQSA
jgi:hypothetical protein